MKHDLDYMLQVMQAANEGKVIQYKDGINHSWGEVREPSWNWGEFDYRIKPEEKIEYVPYENAEEFMQGQKEHGVYFTDKARSDYYLPSCVSSNKNNIGVNGEGYYLTFKTLLKEFVWMDGTPMGKIKL